MLNPDGKKKRTRTTATTRKVDDTLDIFRDAREHTYFCPRCHRRFKYSYSIAKTIRCCQGVLLTPDNYERLERKKGAII